VTLGNIRELGLHHLIASCLSQLGGRTLPPNRPDTVSRETFVHLVWMSDVVFRLSISDRHLSHYEIRSARRVAVQRAPRAASVELSTVASRVHLPTGIANCGRCRWLALPSAQGEMEVAMRKSDASAWRHASEAKLGLAKNLIAPVRVPG